MALYFTQLYGLNLILIIYLFVRFDVEFLHYNRLFNTICIADYEIRPGIGS